MRPDGFTPFDKKSPLLAPWAPIFVRNGEAGLALGLDLREAHTNSRGTAHGGLIAALADQALGMSCGEKLKAEGAPVTGLWTTALSVDYLGAAKPGQWLQVDAVFTHAGRHSGHAEADITADGRTVARARATFRVVLAQDKPG